MKFLFRYTVILFTLVFRGLFCIDFHDFDVYQYKLNAQEVELKIKTYLEKDTAIQRFYKLTSDALYIGDLDHGQIDYVLYLNTKCSSSSSSNQTMPRSLRNARIVLDPGHLGGSFAELEERYIAIPAKKTHHGKALRFHEGDLTYLTALELKQLLEAEGAIVLMTREGIGQGALQENFFEWLEKKHPELRTNVSSKIFRNFYNKEDLLERAKKINDFSPDITIIIHYNAHLTDQEKDEKAFLTQTNYNLVFIPGAFCAGELYNVKDRYEFLRLIVTDDIECSLNLSECIVQQLVNHLNVPLIDQEEKTSYTQTVCLFQKPGIYCRNLALTRLVHSPLCYGETLIQNNEQEVYRLSAQDTFIAGIPCAKRIKEVALAYFEGINQYFNNNCTAKPFKILSRDML